MGHGPGAADMAMSGHGAHGDHMAIMDRDERRARWALYANIGLGLWLAYLFEGETLGAAELLLLAPLVGFGAGMVGGLWRTRQEKN